MGFEKGDRVYISSTKIFGTVTKNTFLGKPGVLLLSDTGDSLAFNEQRANAEIYSKESRSNNDGDVIELPMDVREEGSGILTSLNISPVEQKLFFLKYIIGLSQETQEARINEFNNVKDDEVLKQEFLDGLLAELESDQALVQTEGATALFDIQDEIRTSMSQKLMTEITQEQRETLMLEWMATKNERKGKEKFLHEMYVNLMSDDQYILTEGIKSMSEYGLDGERQKALFAKFLQTSASATKTSFIAEWKQVRGSKSRRRFFLKNIIRQIEAADTVTDAA